MVIWTLQNCVKTITPDSQEAYKKPSKIKADGPHPQDYLHKPCKPSDDRYKNEIKGKTVQPGEHEQTNKGDRQTNSQTDNKSIILLQKGKHTQTTRETNKQTNQGIGGCYQVQ